ncbi:MAG TPA: hypothetical protein VEW48_06860 [Thermoanaerobaculia bacterium]|nr:hypothetical protein [Thermoanaerobaculia bacterium]
MRPIRWTVPLALACALAAGLATAAAGQVNCVNPPRGEIDLEGPHIRVGDAVWAGPTAQVIVKWVDKDGSPPTTQALSRSREDLDAFASRPGSVPVVKICENAASIQPLAFAVDAAAPELTWEVVDLDKFPNRRREARNPKGLSWSGGAKWLPLKVDGEAVRIGSDTPQLLLHGARFDIDGSSVAPNGDQMLRVRFRDSGAGVDHLSFRVLRGSGDHMTLEIETADLVGNARTVKWGIDAAEKK